MIANRPLSRASPPGRMVRPSARRIASGRSRKPTVMSESANPGGKEGWIVSMESVAPGYRAATAAFT